MEGREQVRVRAETRRKLCLWFRLSPGLGLGRWRNSRWRILHLAFNLRSLAITKRAFRGPSPRPSAVLARLFRPRDLYRSGLTFN